MNDESVSQNINMSQVHKVTTQFETSEMDSQRRNQKKLPTSGSLERSLGKVIRASLSTLKEYQAQHGHSQGALT